MFYHCPDCNKKYQTQDFFKLHMKNEHHKEEFTIPELKPKVSIQSKKPIPKTECGICLSSRATMAIIPCGHQCMCEKCSTLLRDRSCPVCRGNIEKICKIYS